MEARAYATWGGACITRIFCANIEICIAAWVLLNYGWKLTDEGKQLC